MITVPVHPQIASNRRRAFLLLAAVVADLTVIGVGVGLAAGAVVDGLVATLAVVLVAPLSPSLAARVSGRDREPVADAEAVSLTRYPPGLVAALEKVDEGRGGGAAPRPRVTAHLWIGQSTPAPPGA